MGTRSVSTQEAQLSKEQAPDSEDARPARKMVAVLARAMLGNVAAHIGAIPFTVIVLALYLLTPAIFDPDLGYGPDALRHLSSVSGGGLKAGDWWSIWTSMFFAANPFDYVMSSLLFVVLVGCFRAEAGVVPHGGGLSLAASLPRSPPFCSWSSWQPTPTTAGWGG